MEIVLAFYRGTPYNSKQNMYGKLIIEVIVWSTIWSLGMLVPCARHVTWLYVLDGWSICIDTVGKIEIYGCDVSIYTQVHKLGQSYVPRNPNGALVPCPHGGSRWSCMPHSHLSRDLRPIPRSSLGCDTLTCSVRAKFSSYLHLYVCLCDSLYHGSCAGYGFHVDSILITQSFSLRV